MKYELSTFASYPREWVVHGTIAVGVCALVAGASFELGRRSGAGPWEGQAVAWRTAFDLARADARDLQSAAIEAARVRTFGVLEARGLQIDASSMTCTPTAPSGFERLFPATGGALYGRSNHGFMGTFERGGNTSSIPGLYFVGGSVHPGAGVPMAVLSGRLCAARVVDDRFGRSPGKEKYVSVRVG